MEYLTRQAQRWIHTNHNMAMLTLITIVMVVQGANADLQDQLITDLLTNYENDVRPQCHFNDKVNATADMSLRQIIDLDEPKQILKLNVWIRMRWSDCRLTWDPSNYSGISHIIVPYKRLWVPDLVLYDNAEATLAGIKDFRAIIKSTGDVAYNFPSILSSLCAINVRYFPFDTQSCVLILGSWAYNGLELDVSNSSNHTDLKSFVRSIEWEVLAAPITYHRDWYDDIFWTSVKFTFSLRRKPLFYIMNILCPCLLITFVAVFGFMLPPESGEKVNLAVTVLLSLAVFQLIVLETIPPSGDSTPFLGIYFMVSMTLVGMSCLLTVTVLQVHYKGHGGKKMPGWVRRYVMIPLSRITCVSTNNPPRDCDKSEKNLDIIIPNGPLEFDEKGNNYEERPKLQTPRPPVDGQIQPFHTLLHTISERLEYFRCHVANQQETEAIDKDWSLLGIMMDRIFMVVYIAVVLTVALSMILPVVLRDQSKDRD